MYTWQNDLLIWCLNNKSQYQCLFQLLKSTFRILFLFKYNKKSIHRSSYLNIHTDESMIVPIMAHEYQYSLFIMRSWQFNNNYNFLCTHGYAISSLVMKLTMTLSKLIFQFVTDNLNQDFPFLKKKSHIFPFRLRKNVVTFKVLSFQCVQEPTSQPSHLQSHNQKDITTSTEHMSPCKM